jgi:small subunit ribosomal protein S6
MKQNRNLEVLSLETIEKRLYEALFLVDTAQAASDWDGTVAVIEKILSRADAEVVSMRKWDERPLAYDINKKGRGTYILIYFNGDPLKITTIERDVQLSEKVVRVMILRTDKMSEEQIAGDTPSEATVKRAAAAAARIEAAAVAAAEAEVAAAAEAAATAAAAPVVEEVVEESPAEEPAAEAVAEEVSEEIKETEPQQ